MNCNIPDCNVKAKGRGCCTSHSTKLRRMYCGESPLIDEAEVIRLGWLEPSRYDSRQCYERRPDTKLTIGGLKWLATLGITPLRYTRENTPIKAPSLTTKPVPQTPVDEPSLPAFTEVDAWTLISKAESPVERIALLYLATSRRYVSPSELITMITDLRKALN